MEETIKLNRLIKPDMGIVSYFYPFPGTKLFKICQEYNLLSTEDMNSSGFLEKPSIKDEHCGRSDCLRMYQKIRLFLASRTLVTSLGLPNFVESIIYRFTNLFPSFFVRLITKRSGLKLSIRKWLFKTVFRER